MFYITVIAAANLLIVLVNQLLAPSPDAAALWYFTVRSLYATGAVIALDGLTAFLIRRLPEKWFRADAALFSVGQKERNLYRHLKINAWKDKVPELGGFSGFHKDKLQSTADTAYLRRFLLESNYGVVIHLVNAVCGAFLPLLPGLRIFSVTIPVAAVNLVLSLLPFFILRYHTPVLLALYRRSMRSSAKGSQEEHTDT